MKHEVNSRRSFLDEWVKAVNQQGGFDKWSWAVSHNPGDVNDIIHNVGGAMISS